MQGSRSFSDAIFLSLLLCAIASGCATVRPEEKERLAEPSMGFTSGGMAERHEQHMLENREASYGAGSARGGGCGCN
ncbi:MAG: DUF4266 domain-containing protein [Polyangiales bacterium]